MKKIIYVFVLSMLLVSLMPAAGFAAKPADAGKPDHAGGGKDDGGDGGGGGDSTSTVGYDVSWPQCGDTLPDDHAYAIVGVNGGTAANTNPCLAEQLEWANTASGSVAAQPTIQLYMNTANPGEVIELAKSWPASNVDKNDTTPTNPYGNTCSGGNDLSCSWLYGWNRALEAAQDRFAPAADSAGISPVAGDYTWWLDVETMNTWQSGSEEALRRNVAAIEGMAAYHQQNGAKVGLYSTAYQWGEITGNYIATDSNLIGLDNWRPSGANIKNAIANCEVAPLTSGGQISLTQYVKRKLDHNYSCL